MIIFKKLDLFMQVKFISFLFVFCIFLSSTFVCIAGERGKINYEEERLGIFALGMNNGILNTELFPNASRAQQAMAIARYEGRTSLFLTVRTGNANDPDHGQSCQIVQFLEEGRGKFSQYPHSITEQLPIGHGQGLGVFYKDDQLYFVSMSSYTDDVKKRYKGISLIHYKGSKTTKKDVKEIQLLPDSASYTNLTPTISTDGKHLIVLAKIQKRHACLVWPIKVLEKPCSPLCIFILNNDISQGNAWQGLCADDKAIYFIHGGTYAAKRHTLAKYSYTGERIDEKILYNEKLRYKQNDGIVRYTNGIPWNIELEGIAIYKKHLYYTGLCTIFPFGDIVRYNGKNYACIKNTDGTQVPDNQKYFIQTEKLSNVEYSEGQKYKNGLQTDQKFYKKYKYLYRMYK